MYFIVAMAPVSPYSDAKAIPEDFNCQLILATKSIRFIHPQEGSNPHRTRPEGGKHAFSIRRPYRQSKMPLDNH
jgi:hypothetical protein